MAKDPPKGQATGGPAAGSSGAGAKAAAPKPVAGKQKTEVEPPNPTDHWRETHEATVKAIQSDRDGLAKDLTKVTETYVQCPHCGRKFNPQAAEKHITACESMIHNKPSKKPAKK